MAPNPFFRVDERSELTQEETSLGFILAYGCSVYKRLTFDINVSTILALVEYSWRVLETQPESQT